MSSSAGPPPSGGDVNEGSSLMAMYIAESAICLVFVVCRSWIRIKLHNFGIDDFCMIIATLAFIGAAIVVSLSAVHGSFRHIYYLNEDEITYALKLNFIGQPLITLSEAFGKISIALLLLRIMGRTSRWYTWFMWLIVFITFASGFTASFLTFFQCENPKALWDVQLRPVTRCWKPSVETDFALWVSTWYTFVDFVLALFPILIIYRLQMSLKRKIALCVLLGLGIVTGIFSAIKTAQITALANRSDAIFYQYKLVAYAAAEEFLMITLGSIPTFKRPYQHISKQASNSKIYISLRNIVSRSRSSRTEMYDSPTKRSHYIRHDDQAHPLENTKGENVSLVYTTRGGHWTAGDSTEPINEDAHRVEDRNITLTQSYEVV